MHLALLRFVPDDAEFSNAERSKMMRMVALAAPIIARKSIAIGEHDTVPARSKKLATNYFS